MEELKEGKVNLVIGIAGSGKTTKLIRLAEENRKDHSVMFITDEMDYRAAAEKVGSYTNLTCFKEYDGEEVECSILAFINVFNNPLVALDDMDHVRYDGCSKQESMDKFMQFLDEIKDKCLVLCSASMQNHVAGLEKVNNMERPYKNFINKVMVKFREEA